MTFAETTLRSKRPASVHGIALPRRATLHPSPADWRDEVIYFLLPDRFSDGKDGTRPALDPAKPTDFRPPTFSFERWSQSGGDRFQGGTIAGVTARLPYIKALGATTAWVGPVFKQRLHVDSYHGYAIQDFLERTSHRTGLGPISTPRGVGATGPVAFGPRRQRMCVSQR